MIRLGRAFLWEIGQMVTVHRRGLFMMVLIPFLYTLLFGGLFSLQTVKEVPIGVVDLDGSKASRDLIQALDDSDDLMVETEAGTEAEIVEDIEKGRIYAAVVLPPRYGEGIAAGRPVSLGAILNNGNTVIGGAAAKGIQAVVGTKSGEAAVSQRMAAGLSPDAASLGTGQIQLSFRSLYHTTGGYIDFFLAVLILHAMQIATVFVLGPMTVLERKRRSAAMRAHPFETAGMKALVYGMAETAVTMISLAAASVLFGLVIEADWLCLTGYIFLFSLAITSFSVLAGAWVKKPGEAISYTLFYIMPSVLFSGAIWPRASMDPLSLFLSWIMPIGYAADAVRDLLVRGSTPHFWLYAGCLFLYIVICLLGAAAGFQRKGGETVA